MVKIGVIGAGYWGPNLIRNFFQLPECDLKAVCDLDPKKLEKVRSAYPGVKTVTNEEELIESSEIEGVVIATGGATHYALAKKALEAGKDVLVEKPLALNVKDGEELVNLSEKKNRILMVGHLLLYHPAVNWLKERIQRGDLGEIRYIYSQRVNLGKVRKDENALWSFGPHDISVVLYLLNSKPEKIIATGEAYLRESVYDVVFVVLHFPGGELAHVHVSWLDPHKIRKVTIVGSRKMAVFDDTEGMEKIRLYDKGVDYEPAYASYPDVLTLRIGDIHIPKVDSSEPLRLECQHFLDCIENRRRPISDGRNGLDVLKILDAAQKSLESGGHPMKLEDA